MKILSFDIGGTFTKLAIININKQKYQIIFKDKYLTCQCGNEGIQIFNGIALKAKELASRYAFKAIALSITGIVDSKKKIVITPSYVFKHFHMLAIEKIINKHIHLPVYCANDARCAL
jgi:predicted NBD/HSP70 family sugar kinase